MSLKDHLVIGTPFLNEETGILRYLAAIDLLAGKLRSSWAEMKVSILFVDDGSTDATIPLIQSYAPANLHQIEIYSLSRNYGPYAAISAIFELTEGDALVIMDADLQDSPGVVPEMVRAWKDGSESVRIIRGKRAEGRLFSFASKFYYKFFAAISGLNSHMGTFGLYDRKVIEAVKRFPERGRYIPGLISLVGFKTKLIPADRDARAEGESKVGFLKLLRFAMMATVSFSSIPIDAITLVGFAISLLSFVAVILVVAIKIFAWEVAIPGWASFLVAQFFLGGLITFSLGVIGQYIGVIFNEVKARPVFLIASSTKKHFAREGTDRDVPKAPQP